VIVTTKAASPATAPSAGGEARTTYRRVVATRRGGPDVLELVEERVPEPGLGEARLRVLAAGVGFPDILMREGTYPGGPKWPFTPGCDSSAGSRRSDREPPVCAPAIASPP
jgi:hypothetical protein